MTKTDELNFALVQDAEEKFFKGIQGIKDDRIKAGKPLHYSVTDRKYSIFVTD